MFVPVRWMLYKCRSMGDFLVLTKYLPSIRVQGVFGVGCGYTRFVDSSKAEMPFVTSHGPPVMYCGVVAFGGEKYAR